MEDCVGLDPDPLRLLFPLLLCVLAGRVVLGPDVLPELADGGDDVWWKKVQSLTQIYSADFSQSRIDVKKMCFVTNTQSRFASVVFLRCP